MNDSIHATLSRKAFTICPNVAALNLPSNLGAIRPLTEFETSVVERLVNFSYWPIVQQNAHKESGMSEEDFYCYLPATMRFLAVCAFTDEDVAMRSPKVDMVWHAAQGITPVYALLCVYALRTFVVHIPDLSSHDQPVSGDYCCTGSMHCKKSKNALGVDSVVFELGLLIKQIESSQQPISLAAKLAFFRTYEMYFGTPEDFWERIPNDELASVTV